jgi:AbrB family looped-hinge helix DNA binding protein
MEAKVIKVTDKGQISIPTDIRKSVNIKKGDKIIIIRSGKRILIEKLKESDFSDLLRHSEKVAKRLWDNKEDEVWNNV